MAHPNEDLLRNLDQAMVSGDLETFFSYHADDITVHVSGKSKLAGDYKGKEQLQALFEQVMEAFGPEYSFETHAYLADDEHGITLQRSTARRGDQTLELDEVFVNHFANGKISELWYVPVNQAAFDDWIG
jgi:ketosteroid isomerase-like protein